MTQPMAKGCTERLFPMRLTSNPSPTPNLPKATGDLPQIAPPYGSTTDCCQANGGGSLCAVQAVLTSLHAPRPSAQGMTNAALLAAVPWSQGIASPPPLPNALPRDGHVHPQPSHQCSLPVHTRSRSHGRAPPPPSSVPRGIRGVGSFTTNDCPQNHKWKVPRALSIGSLVLATGLIYKRGGGAGHSVGPLFCKWSSLLTPPRGRPQLGGRLALRWGAGLWATFVDWEPNPSSRLRGVS